MRDGVRQMPGQPGRTGAARSEAVQIPISDEPDGPRHITESTGSALLQAALTRENLQKAFKRVRVGALILWSKCPILLMSRHSRALGWPVVYLVP